MITQFILFKDKLDSFTKTLQPEFDKLADIALSSQAHDGDLLLMYINGFFDENIFKSNQMRSEKLNPHESYRSP